MKETIFQNRWEINRIAVTYLTYVLSSAIRYLSPGSKSFSLNFIGDSMPWYLLVSFHHSVLYRLGLILLWKTPQRHRSIWYPNGRKAILSNANFIKALISVSRREIHQRNLNPFLRGADNWPLTKTFILNQEKTNLGWKILKLHNFHSMC